MPPYFVEHAQIYKAWEAFLKEHPAEYIRDFRDAIRGGTLNKWDDYFRINIIGYPQDVELKPLLKSESIDALLETLDAWEKSTESFADAVALEIRDAGKQYVEAYFSMLEKYAANDISSIFNTPRIALVVKEMMQWLPAQQSLPEKIQRCQEFFSSRHFDEIPHEWIFAHMFAAIKSMAKQGAFANRLKARKRLNGVFGDIAHISLYAPYCDAIVIDKFMADLTTKPEVALDRRYGVKVFSLSNWDELLNWLNDLEGGMTQEHRNAISAAYPEALI